MLELLAALALVFGLTTAAVLLRRRRPPDPEQGLVLQRLEHLGQQTAQLAAATQAQQQHAATLLEAARSQQQSVAALHASVAEQRQQVAGLQAAVAAAGQGLAEVKAAAGLSTASLVQGLNEAKQLLAQVQATAKERAEREGQAWSSLDRLEQIITGTHSRGAAGENLLAEVIKQLPPEFRAYDVRIGGKTVEFALPLPNGRYLPVDSKWTSVGTVEALATCAPEERADLVTALQKDVERKVDEVAKYLDPDKTCMMAVLAVPDAVYGLCAEAHVTAHRRGVVIVPYSMAVPYVLSTLQVIRRFGARVDEAQLSHMVNTVLGALTEVSDELEGRFSRGLTQLENSRRAMKGSVGKAQQVLGRVQLEGALPASSEGSGQAVLAEN